MGATTIEWTDWSVNPIKARREDGQGRSGHYCEKVSPGCAHCYASRMQPRFGLPTFAGEPQRQARLASLEVYFDPWQLDAVLSRRKSTRIFWCDMTDLFGAWVPWEWIDLCFAAMALTPQHVHQVLTKRADRMFSYLSAADVQERIARAQAKLFPLAATGDIPWPLPNVWIGVSAEDQQRWDERTHWLYQTRAAVRWVSAEPLLGPIDCRLHPGSIFYPRPDWIVIGGESGPHARGCDLKNVTGLVRQFREACLPVFLKQLGANPYDSRRAPAGGDRLITDEEWERDPQGARLRLQHPKGGDPDEWPKELNELELRQFPRGFS